MKKKTTKLPSNVVLPDPLIKALSLLTSTELTMKEIAEACKIDYDHLCDIYIGKNPKDNETILFQAGLKKIDTLLKDKAKRLMSENRLIVLEEINELLRDMRKNKQRDERVLVPILNALAKANAGVEINANVMNTTFNSMTSEELVHEFRRLTAITGSSKAK